MLIVFNSQMQRIDKKRQHRVTGTTEEVFLGILQSSKFKNKEYALKQVGNTGRQFATKPTSCYKLGVD